MPNESLLDFEKRGASSELVVLLHGYDGGPTKMRHVRAVVAEKLENADIFVPTLPIDAFSFADPFRVVNDVIDQIGRHWENREVAGESYHRIILVGHSVGAVIARKVYVQACGENADAPWGQTGLGKGSRSWAGAVTRIVLLAAMNRGWRISHHLSFKNALPWSLGSALGHLVSLVSQRRTPFIFSFRRGAPFMAQLRIEWLSMLRHAEAKSLGNATTVQLLGTVDDLVSPEDNIDLITGSDFVYLDVPMSGHINILEMDDSTIGVRRGQIFAQALVSVADDLKTDSVRPGDLMPQPVDSSVTDVVFVIHGIRDRGYWTEKIGRTVKRLGRHSSRVFQTETSSYGYFAMLPFALPWTRKSKVEWLMDEYTEDLALYPNADFSFVGHSNGTYLLAKALKDYPACHFKRVVFAGSVVPTWYDWKSLFDSNRVEAVLNYVATADWVVALFPKGFEQLGLQDLGSAGHDGFSAAVNPGLSEVKFVAGHHSAALAESNWESIANFIVNGKVAVPPSAPLARARETWAIALGTAPPAIWLIGVGILVLIGWFLLLALESHPVLQTLVLGLYALTLFRVATKL